MRVVIEIDCEEISELWHHLDVLKDQVKARAIELKLNPHENEFPEGTVLEDSNCYGTHELTVMHENKEL